jgi:hypothetical protein
MEVFMEGNKEGQEKRKLSQNTSNKYQAEKLKCPVEAGQQIQYQPELHSQLPGKPGYLARLS